MAEMPFVSALVQEDLPVWQQCLDTEFLRRMEDGTLDEACFKGYIVEDSLYLREYAKVFAWGMTKARTMETLRNYYSLLGFVQESEDVTRLHYLKQFGLSEADLQALPLRPENRAYVDCMINAAKKRRGRGRMHHGLPALHAELRLDLPENAGPLPCRAGHPLRPAGAGLRRSRLCGRLPRLGRLCGKGVHRPVAGARSPLPRHLPRLLGA